MDFKLSFRLKQHTPIIHFQHDQEGATLRATELKPKLDRYLLAKFPELKECLVGGGISNKDHQALDYKLKVLANDRKMTPIEKNAKDVPMFFANMGNDYQERGLVTHAAVKLEFHSFHRNLIEAIQANLGQFLACTNFGMRSSKGFGSFTLEGSAAEPPDAYWFDLPHSSSWKHAFATIDLFYKSVRGGINGAPDPNGGFVRGFYMKPMLFSYALSQGIKWEKKAIKERRPFDRQLDEQQRTHRDNTPQNDQPNWPLWVAEPNERIVRDVLGLSTDQTWKGYPGGRNGATVSKEDTRKRIERFPSPLVFKPIQLTKGFRIYFWGEPMPSAYRNASFIILVNDRKVVDLPMWKEFKLDEFLKNHLTRRKAEEAMKYNRNDRKQSAIADILLKIYADIEKNRTNGQSQ